MVSFFFWTVIKLTAVVVIGYFISKLINETKTEKKLDELGKQYEQQLIENKYPHLMQDIEAALAITGLKMHEQKYPPHQKPVFYFKLSNQHTQGEVRNFLNSLPQLFEVGVPSLKISIEDSLLQTICFWKAEEKFQLALKQPGVYKILGVMETEELSEKIHAASAEFNFQNISVQRMILS